MEMVKLEGKSGRFSLEERGAWFGWPAPQCTYDCEVIDPPHYAALITNFVWLARVGPINPRNRRTSPTDKTLIDLSNNQQLRCTSSICTAHRLIVMIFLIIISFSVPKWRYRSLHGKFRVIYINNV